ncbi:hypothetical protein Landi51_06081 [Colletotrichum acutatum]
MDALSYSAGRRKQTHLRAKSGREAPSQCAAAAAAAAVNCNGNGFFFFEHLKADAGATGVDIRREGHSAALVLLSFTASQKRTTRWFYQPGLVAQILGALMQALWGVISSACDRKHTRVPPQFAQQ